VFRDESQVLPQILAAAEACYIVIMRLHRIIDCNRLHASSTKITYRAILHISREISRDISSELTRDSHSEESSFATARLRPCVPALEPPYKPYFFFFMMFQTCIGSFAPAFSRRRRCSAADRASFSAATATASPSTKSATSSTTAGMGATRRVRARVSETFATPRAEGGFQRAVKCISTLTRARTCSRKTTGDDLPIDLKRDSNREWEELLVEQ